MMMMIIKMIKNKDDLLLYLDMVWYGTDNDQRRGATEGNLSGPRSFFPLLQKSERMCCMQPATTSQHHNITSS